MTHRANDYRDVDPQETLEWLEAIDVVLEREGPLSIYIPF